MKRTFFVFFAIPLMFSAMFYAGCDKKNTTSTEIIKTDEYPVMKEDRELVLDQSVTQKKLSQSKESENAGNTIPNYLYVNSHEGLRIRKEPSLESVQIGSVHHCSPLKVTEIGEKVTIDNIENNWVKVLLPCYEWQSDTGEYGWVFGGYLEEKKPVFSVETEKALSEYIQSEWFHEIAEDLYYVYIFSGPEDGFAFTSGKEGTSDVENGTWKVLGKDKIQVCSEFWYQDGEEYKVIKNEPSVLSVEVLNEYEINIDGKKCYRYAPALKDDDYKISNYRNYVFKTFEDSRNFFQNLKKRTRNWTLGNFNRDEVIKALIKYGLYDEEYCEQYNSYWRNVIQD